MFSSFLFVPSFEKLLPFTTNSPIVSSLVCLVRGHQQKYNKLLMFKRTNPYVRINIMLNSQHNFVLHAFKKYFRTCLPTLYHGKSTPLIRL